MGRSESVWTESTNDADTTLDSQEIDDALEDDFDEDEEAEAEAATVDSAEPNSNASPSHLPQESQASAAHNGTHIGADFNGAKPFSIDTDGSRAANPVSSRAQGGTPAVFEGQ